MQLVVEEPESEQLAAALSTGNNLAINLVDLSRGDMIAAGTHAPLRSNDAIQLAVPFRLAADEMVTYDAELATAARNAGLTVLSPGT